ncbi:MAG: nucleotide exchange factor GrpE [Chloroflexota bacterium]|nr:MAG: nucleotide exchange factor GrpE [Chloroflexota bacterium]
MEEARDADQEGSMTEPEDEVKTSPKGETDTLRAELDEANKKAEEFLSLLQRAQADFANYRKRVDQERADAATSTKANVILKFLPVLDDFERALQAIPTEDRQVDWVQGINLIQRKLRSILEAEGVTRMEPLGKEFDPWEHEAVLYQESPDHPEGEVIAVFRDGYKLNGRVIRPAQVVVAKGAKD